MKKEEFLLLIDTVISGHPEWYSECITVASSSWIKYKKGLDAIEAQNLLLISLVPKAIRQNILKKINKDMFHPEIIKKLKEK